VSWRLTREASWRQGDPPTTPTGTAERLSLDEARETARSIIAEYIHILIGLRSIAKPAAPEIASQNSGATAIAFEFATSGRR